MLYRIVRAENWQSTQLAFTLIQNIYFWNWIQHHKFSISVSLENRRKAFVLLWWYIWSGSLAQCDTALYHCTVCSCPCRPKKRPHMPWLACGLCFMWKYSYIRSICQQFATNLVIVGEMSIQFAFPSRSWSSACVPTLEILHFNQY